MLPTQEVGLIIEAQVERSKVSAGPLPALKDGRETDEGVGAGGVGGGIGQARGVERS